MTDHLTGTRIAGKTLPILSWVGFVILVVAISLALVRTKQSQSTLEEQISDFHRQRIELEGQIRKEEELRSKAKDDRERIEAVFGLFRDIDDIPEFSGPRILSKQIQEQSLFLYLPSGTHRIHINATWTVTPKPTEDATGKNGNTDVQKSPPEKLDQAPSDPELTSGKRNWTIDLLPDSTYHFQLSGFRYSTETVGWKLDSGNPEFQTLNQVLPLPEFRMAGGSWGYRSSIRAPNETSLLAWHNLQNQIATNATSNSGSPNQGVSNAPVVFSARKRGRISGLPITLDIEIQLESDGPATLPASQINGRPRSLKALDHFQYAGDGFYTEKPDSQETE